MTAVNLFHPLCPESERATKPALQEPASMTLYPELERIMTLATFEKIAQYDNQQMLSQITPYMLPAGFLSSLPTTYCKGPTGFQYQFFSFLCKVQSPAATVEQPVRVFALDPGKVAHYKGWWGIVQIPGTVPGAYPGGESDNVHGTEARRMIDDLVADRKYTYRWRQLSGKVVDLQLERISEVAEQTFAAPAASSGPVQRSICHLV